MADTGEYCRHHCSEFLSLYIKNQIENKTGLGDGIVWALILFFLILMFSLSKPIPANAAYPQTEQQITANTYTQTDFENDIIKKYKTNKVYFPTDGVAHVKKIKYINSKPIKINIVEVNTKVNPNLIIKPKTAGNKLNSKTTVRKMAQNEKAVVAINGGYFKPQTGVPLGVLVIDGKMLTGPIYNRVGIGIFDNNGEISYAMDNIGVDILAYTKSTELKIDNINQPRISQAYTLLYSSHWGKISPPPPKNGYNMLIQNNLITKISANPIPISENEFVISSSKDKIINFAKNKEVHINLKVLGKLKNAKHIIGAGPYLIKNSEVYVDTKTQKFQSIAGKNPRSAIGYTKEGNLIFLTADGREKYSAGMTLIELAKLMKSIGCDYAMNFDGGSSSALYVKNRIVNGAINKEGALVSNSLIIKENSDDIQISFL